MVRGGLEHCLGQPMVCYALLAMVAANEKKKGTALMGLELLIEALDLS